MKASSTTEPVAATGPRDLDRTRRTVVALALRNKTLSGAVAARLSAERDAETLVWPLTEPAHLVPWLGENHADVLLLDERWLYHFEGRGAPSLIERWPDLSVLLVGDQACTALAEHVVRHRFRGFLLAKSAAETCVKAIRTVKRGEMWVPRALLVELLFEHVHAAGRRALEIGPDTKLTRRELEVIGYVRRGFANKQIGESLAIREDTVKKHLRNAYMKLGIHRRSEIITSSAQRLVSG